MSTPHPPTQPPRDVYPLHAPQSSVVLLCQNKEQHARELEWLNPKVAAAESRAVEIESLVDQMNLKLSLLSASHRKASEDAADLKVEAVTAEGLQVVIVWYFGSCSSLMPVFEDICRDFSIFTRYNVQELEPHPRDVKHVFMYGCPPKLTIKK